MMAAGSCFAARLTLSGPKRHATHMACEFFFHLEDVQSKFEEWNLNEIGKREKRFFEILGLLYETFLTS
jgi:hypothetical protein